MTGRMMQPKKTGDIKLSNAKSVQGKVSKISPKPKLMRAPSGSEIVNF
jgi:hypothetical protein